MTASTTSSNQATGKATVTTVLPQPIGKDMESTQAQSQSQDQPSQELSEIFFVENNRRKQSIRIQVKLCPEGVYLRRQTEQDDHINEQLIRIDDIIGSRYGSRLKKRARGGLSSCKNPNANVPEPEDEQHQPQAGGTGKDNSAFLYIYAYLKKEKPLRRVQTLRILRFRSSNDFAENLRTAELWHHTIRQHKLQRSGNSGEKQLLILLNPKSGSGKGRELFQKQVAPLLREAEAQYDLQITTHPNYAQEFVRTNKNLLERYSGIVVASGDGLFYEVLNGLMERMDWRRVCRELPLGIIPCGSGNGLAKSVAHHCNEPYEPKPILHATLTCVAGKSTPMDVVRVELSRRDKHYVMYSFLSVGWGLIADIDIESERLRSIGAQRFTLWAIRRLITLRSYKGKLYYKLAKTEGKSTETKSSTEADPPAPSTQNVELRGETSSPITQQQIDESNRLGSQRLSLPINSPEFKDIPDDDDAATAADNETIARKADDDEFSDVMSLNRSIYRQHADSWHSAVSRRTAYYSVGGQSTRSNRSRLSVAQKIEDANAEFAELVPTGTMPGLQLPLPSADGWISEDGDFVMVHAAYTTHLASDCFFAPDSRLNDGLIYLVIIRAGVGRPQLLNFLLSMNSGTHLPETNDDPYIQVVAVEAFRIEPSGKQGILTVDGERVDYGPIQAEVFPGMIKVMTTNGE
ncbi:sphingosine kinase 1 [Drosophila tropicalis]|uniref:sphingosine kinase 1 n=1 Tax=Drosophila tropicalis TaxID=46794 RepID=UPI0035ABD9F6